MLCDDLQQAPDFVKYISSHQMYGNTWLISTCAY